MEVLQTSALPLGDGADRNAQVVTQGIRLRVLPSITATLKPGCVSCAPDQLMPCPPSRLAAAERNLRLTRRAKDGAGNGIRTRDFDLGKVALYH